MMCTPTRGRTFIASFNIPASCKASLHHTLSWFSWDHSVKPEGPLTPFHGGGAWTLPWLEPAVIFPQTWPSALAYICSFESLILESTRKEMTKKILLIVHFGQPTWGHFCGSKAAHTLGLFRFLLPTFTLGSIKWDENSSYGGMWVSLEHEPHKIFGHQILFPKLWHGKSYLKLIEVVLRFSFLWKEHTYVDSFWISLSLRSVSIEIMTWGRVWEQNHKTRCMMVLRISEQTVKFSYIWVTERAWGKGLWLWCLLLKHTFSKNLLAV